MKQGEQVRIAGLLEALPWGELTVAHHSSPPEGELSLTHRLSAKTRGKGRMDAYRVFPGLEISYNIFLASEVTFHHPPSSSVLELFYCRSGRVGWNMRGGTAIYLGAGDVTVHSAACCADSAMMLPLGYAEGISVCMELPVFIRHCPDLLQKAGMDWRRMETVFCAGEPVTLSASAEVEGIFAPLYAAVPSRREAYLQLKAQELLLYLMDFQPDEKLPAQYFSQQTELIKEIHRQLTEHPERRFTIEELSRQYLINTSTLKEVFKAVYGLPIATYMKEYRVRQAMKLLRETDASISEISRQVGYSTQGKFSKAFEDVTQTLPREYRKMYRGRGTDREGGTPLASEPPKA